MLFFRQSRDSGLNPADAVARAARGEITLIDVREHTEVSATGKAVGALHIPLMRLRDMADSRHPDFNTALADGRPIAVYCASGGRSQHASRLLSQLGYDDVHNIGGLNAWVSAGGQIERV